MISLRFILVLASCSLVGLCNLSILSSESMDNKEKEDFLASVEAEEDWLDQVSRRLSLPFASTANTTPSSSRTTAHVVNTKVPASAGPATRSSRKRRISRDSLAPADMSDCGQAPGKRSTRDDSGMFKKLEAMIS